MSDTLGTIWPCLPHTQAKHRILERYLKAWMPIVASFVKKPQRVLFVDGFAGPGQYERGEPGSPVVALRAAAQHSRTFPVPIDFLFIEKDPERLAHLIRVLDGMKAELAWIQPAFLYKVGIIKKHCSSICCNEQVTISQNKIII